MGEEQILNPNGWLNLGIPGAALFIVLIIIVLMFRQQSKSIDKLCDKLDRLVDSFVLIQTSMTGQQELDRVLISDIKESYIKISNKISDQTIKIDEIQDLCKELVTKERTIPIGAIAINKGYITKEQLQDCLAEQDSLLKRL